VVNNAVKLPSGFCPVVRSDATISGLVRASLFFFSSFFSSDFSSDLESDVLSSDEDSDDDSEEDSDFVSVFVSAGFDSPPELDGAGSEEELLGAGVDGAGAVGGGVDAADVAAELAALLAADDAADDAA
jgi:hypothetical protein